MEDVKVSISCITYNQKDYIAKALESFLMQKTNFKYEILVHDDASTDGTAEILKEYEKKYPDIIKCVYQKENQYSKRKKITIEFLVPLYKGKYVAYCEGDDYWTDPHKLQKQYDYMEAHPECTMCIHSSIEVKADNCHILSKNVLSDKITEFGIVDAIKGLGRKTATNSFFLKRECAIQTPEFRMVAPCGDYIYPIIASMEGKVVYLPEIMSAHRANANSSMSKLWKKNYNSRKIYYERFDKMLECLDEYTNYQYSDYLKAESIRNWSLYYIMTKNKDKTKEEPYKTFIKSQPVKLRIRWYLDVNASFVVEVMRKIKHMLIDIKYSFKREGI